MLETIGIILGIIVGVFVLLFGGKGLIDLARERRERKRQISLSTTTILQERVDNLPDKPSIAVLPFENLSGDPEQEYFSDGITEDIITALSRIRQFFVIARNSTFAYKGTSPDVRRVAKDLGVRYVLEGSVRIAFGPNVVAGRSLDQLR